MKENTTISIIGLFLLTQVLYNLFGDIEVLKVFTRSLYYVGLYGVIGYMSYIISKKVEYVLVALFLKMFVLYCIGKIFLHIYLINKDKISSDSILRSVDLCFYFSLFIWLILFVLFGVIMYELVYRKWLQKQ